ncbi:hypothetical protein NPIL_524791, partial [Nephila pilipes]
MECRGAFEGKAVLERPSGLTWLCVRQQQNIPETKRVLGMLHGTLRTAQACHGEGATVRWRDGAGA